MQREREVRDSTDSSGSMFDSFGGFGSRGRMFPSLFGRHDPFDNPFFSRPFGSLFESGPMFNSDGPRNLRQTSPSKGPVIEELDSDDERVAEENEDGDKSDAAWANRNPLVEHPEDQNSGNGRGDKKSKAQAHRTNHTKVEGTQPQTIGVTFKRVTYGGVNGAYYTATTSSRRGEDGVTFEDSKQADKTTGQVTHRISRGIHDKGHSVTRRLDSDGKVNTMQTLHNLEEDELADFEQAWKGNVDSHFRGFEDRFGFPGNIGSGGSWHSGLVSRGAFGDPFRELLTGNGGQSMDSNFQSQSSQGRPKKVVRINIE